MLNSKKTGEYISQYNEIVKLTVDNCTKITRVMGGVLAHETGASELDDNSLDEFVDAVIVGLERMKDYYTDLSNELDLSYDINNEVFNMIVEGFKDKKLNIRVTDRAKEILTTMIEDWNFEWIFFYKKLLYMKLEVLQKEQR